VSEERQARWRRILVLAGVALSLLLLARARAGGDQLNLLARGWLLAERGELVAYGNPLSSGGNGPGALTSVLVGLPLMVWRDARAPIAVIWLFHLAAYLLLDRALRALGERFRMAFAVIYWLAPWRLVYSAFLWNPNYLFLAGAVHFASARASRERARFFASFAHVLTLGLAFQLHPSTLLLAVLSVFLVARGYARVHGPGALAGGAVAAATLVPWLRAAAARPEILAASTGFFGRGLLYVYPLLRGVAYWFRYGTLYLSEKVARFDFGETLGPEVDRWLAPAVNVLWIAAGVASLGVALVAAWRFARPRWRGALRRLPAAAGDRDWVAGYVVLAFVAAVAVYAASPTTIMPWQGLPLLHAAVMPLAFFWDEALAGAGARSARRGLAALAVASLALGIALAAGSPTFRCAGRGTLVFPLRASSPMFDDLGLQRSCPWPLDIPGTWWPDVLPEERAGGPQ
jgi:hypothetical protein